MAQFGFGVGNLYLVPSGVNPTPIRVGVLMDVSLDFSFDMKELRGQYQFPVDIARAGAKLSGKAKSGQISSQLINSILTGSTIANTGILGVADEPGTVPGSVAYTITVANGATFAEDLGVIKVSTGLYMKRVATVAAAGEYSVNTTTGVYTFHSTEANSAVLISYTYTAPSANKLITYSNQLMGSGEVYQLHLFNSFRSKATYLKLHAVTFPKWNFALKQEGYSEQDFDFQAFADSTNKILSWSQTE